MRATKHSGVDWLGDIPADWLVRPLKRNTYIKARVGWKGLTSDEFEVESFAYLVTGRDFSSKVIDFSECYQVSQERYLDDPFIQLKQGDILITKDGTIGKTAWVNELDKPACLNSGIFVVRPRADYISEFLFWVLESAVFKEFIRLVSSGSTIQHLYQNVFENFSFGIPPVEEQRRIADFLDRETAKIDTLIAKQEQLITTLDERRNAFTSLLFARISDEGIRRRVSAVAQLINGFPFDSESFDIFGEVPLVRIRDILSDEFETFVPRNSVPGKAWIRNGDIVIGMDGDFNLKLWNRGAAALNQRVCVLRTPEPIIGSWIAHCLPAELKKINDLTYATTVKHLSSTQIARIMIPMPELPEMNKVAKQLDREHAGIDKLLRRIRETQTLLRERRQALISAAVTGKLEVADGYS